MFNKCVTSLTHILKIVPIIGHWKVGTQTNFQLIGLKTQSGVRGALTALTKNLSELIRIKLYF